MGNHNSGRRPAPSALKVLRGKRPLNLEEPGTLADPVVMPAGLSSGAAAVWARLASVCVHMRTLSVADVPAFVKLCELEGSFAALMHEKTAPGFKLLRWAEDGTGERVLRVHPVLRLERELAAALRPYYEHFGLTPAARSRIYVKPAEAAPVSRWA